MNLALVRFIPIDTAIPFIKMRFGAFIVSALLMLGSIGAFATMGLNFGIDFRGGTLIEIGVEEGTSLSDIRGSLGSLDLGDLQVQEFGEPTDLLVRVERVSVEDGAELQQWLRESGLDVSPRLFDDPVEDDDGAQQIVRATIQAQLNSEFDNIEYRRVEVLGGQVSDELRVAGTTAVIVALVLMLIYIWFRFEWQYSVGAVIALIHDVIATIGFFAITQLEFNLSTIAAILTIVGYSMNDTVVVYDRIREKFRKFKSVPTNDVLNMAINKTLSRTILTSGTTLVAIIAMAIIGGPALEGFALAMIWGVVVGTYSSIFVAAPLLTLTGVKRESGEDGATSFIDNAP